MKKNSLSPTLTALFFGLILFISSFFSCPSAFADAAPISSGSEKESQPIQIHGDNVEYFHEQQKAVGEGNVSIDYQGSKLTADKITVYLESKKALAEGHVTLAQSGSVFKGDRAEYDFGKKVGDVTNMSATIEPTYYGKAKKIEKISDNHYRTSNSYITTCCGDSPFYRIQAQQVDIFPGEKVVARNAMLYVGGVPILFIPYFVTYFVDFDRFPAQLVPGKNSEWGAFLLSKWRYHLVESPAFTSRGNVLLDYRARRGVGAGVENFYKGDKVGRGAVRFYYADDDEPSIDADSERYRVQWRHQAKLTESTTLTTEINKLSDATIIKDFFFREEYERDVFPDNYVSLITAKPEYTFSILGRKRLDDFFNVVERTPEIRFDTHTKSFQDTPFYIRQEVQFSNLQKRFANSDTSLEATRLDANHTLYYAGRMGPVSVTPHVGTRQTFYSRDLDDTDQLLRGTFDAGIDFSVRYFRTYNVHVKSFGLDYNQIRHIFSPTMSYNFRPNPTVARTTLQQFDFLDSIDKQHFIRYAFENKLQTKEHNESGELVMREIARIIPFFDTDFDTHHLENIGIDVELRPYSWLGIYGDATVDTYTRDVNTANLDVHITRKNVDFAIGQRYLQDSSSQMTAQVKWQVNKDVELKVYERYEFEEDISKEFEVTVSRTLWDCVIVDLSYNHRETEGDSFFFLFRLKAFPQASFRLSQSYNTPKATTNRL